MKQILLTKETFKGHCDAVANHFIRLNRNSNQQRFFNYRSEEMLSELVSSFKTNFRFDHYWILFQDRNQNVIGIGQLTLDMNGGGEIAISVDDNQQNKGLGKKIMSELISLSKELELKFVEMSCLVSNRKICSLVKQFGFTLKPDSDTMIGKLYLSYPRKKNDWVDDEEDGICNDYNENGVLAFV